MSVKWQVNKQCPECPWRKDVPTGKFTIQRFEALRQSVEQGWGTMFACHQSPECDKRACVGYVVNQVFGPGDGPQNFNLRHALARRRIDPEKMTIVGPQYLTYDEMVEANRHRRKHEHGEDSDGDAGPGSQQGGPHRCRV